MTNIPANIEFNSKLQQYFSVILILLFLTFCINIFSGKSSTLMAIVEAIPLLIVAMFTYNKYTVTENKEIIILNPFSKNKIEISSITKIKLTKSSFFMPGGALEIYYNMSDTIKIYPEQRKEFTTIILEYNPVIEVIDKT